MEITGNADWTFQEKKKLVKQEREQLTKEEFDVIMNNLEDLTKQVKYNLDLLYSKYPNKIVYDNIIYSDTLINNIKNIEL